jgi:hypothetical protein
VELIDDGVFVPEGVVVDHWELKEVQRTTASQQAFRLPADGWLLPAVGSGCSPRRPATGPATGRGRRLG